MENARIAEIFDEIADLLDFQKENAFKIRSYRNAAQTIRGLSRRLEDMVEQGEDLQDLPNIGESIAGKIGEIVETGTCGKVEDLRKKVPHGLVEVMGIPGVGPRKAKELYDELGIKGLDGLRKACREHRVRDLPGMGEKTEANILDGIKTFQSTSGRIFLKTADEAVESLGRHLQGIKPLKKWEAAGSYRRRKETIGDLDILIQADDRDEATRAILRYDAIARVDSRGKERVTVHLESGLQVDFRFFDPSSFGSALLYFTGSKEHNVVIRKKAQKKNWKLNEYGLFTGKRRLAGKTEKSVYARLAMDWIPPELRESRGEIEAAEKGTLPRLIEAKDIRGDLHCHTNATDGRNSLKEMVEAARDRGYDYLAITEHSKQVRVADGLDDSGMKRHADKIRAINDEYKDIRVMTGVEVDILKDGSLDLQEDLLEELDWVSASVHSHFGLGEKEMTERLLAAIRSGVIHCLSHPTARMIGRRDPIDVDWDKVFEACGENGVCLEINAQPERMDLPDVHVRRAKEGGLKFAICTDAHSVGGFDLMPFGLSVARRGWLTKGDVVNTFTVKKLGKYIGSA